MKVEGMAGSSELNIRCILAVKFHGVPLCACFSCSFYLHFPTMISVVLRYESLDYLILEKSKRN